MPTMQPLTHVTTTADGITRAVIVFPASLRCLPLNEASREIERTLVEAASKIEQSLTETPTLQPVDEHERWKRAGTAAREILDRVASRR